jgi:hypothetical protein
MRYDHALNTASFAGGSDPQGSTLVVNKSYEFLTGLAVGGGKLFVGDPNRYVSQSSDSPSPDSVIRVYDTSSLGKGQITSFPAPRSRGLAVDGDGDLWVLEQADATHPAMVVRYTPAGKATGQVVTGVADPTSIAVDTSSGGVGRLLVTDNGPDQNVKIFTGLDSTPKQSATFGVTGGVNAGPVPGIVGPRRFNGPDAVGVDATGNIYVASDGTPSFAVQGYGQGVSLEAYHPDGTLMWQDYGQKYNTSAGIDPTTGTDIYTTFDHYTIDLNKPPGHQWTRVGWTLDPRKYPDDPRIHWGGDDLLPTSPTVRDIDGHRFLFYGNGMGDVLDIYRFQPPSQTAIPSGAFDIAQAKSSPSPGEFIWRDTNGDGDSAGNVTNEYFHPASPANIDVTGWWVDSRGDVWQTTKTHGIREFPFGGIDAHGNPIYSYTTMRTYPTPHPFTDPRRLVYDPTTDTLVISGYTTDHPTPTYNGGDYKFAGTELASYRNFTHTTSPAVAWSASLPYAATSSDAAHKPITLTVAGHYAFVGYFTDAGNQHNSDIHIYNLANGAPAGVLSPGDSIGNRSGNLDMEDGTTAYQTTTGHYLVLTEDDGYDKTIMYDWTAPDAPTTTSPVIVPPPSTKVPPTSAPHVIRLVSGRDHHTRKLSALHTRR